MRYTTRIIVPPRIRRSGQPGTPGGAYGPQVLGVRKTIGLGDRLGVATSAYLAIALAHPDFAPVFAQQSAWEIASSGQAYPEIIGGAARHLSAARFRQPWGADANRLCTAQEVVQAAEAGFTCFTFDPTEFVRPGVDGMSPDELQAGVDALVAEGDLPDHWAEPYLNRTIDLPGSHQLRITQEPLQRAALRYAPAVLHCARLSAALSRANQGRPFEVEVALDSVEAPATALEHLFIGLELESRGVRLTGLALRLPDGPAEWETTLREHAAVAEFCGPYKLVFDEVEDPATLYPVVGRTCDGALHVKTSSASYLEALRVVARVDPALFRAITAFSVQKFQEEREIYGFVTPSTKEMSQLVQASTTGDEATLLDTALGRRCLGATFGSVLGNDCTTAGLPFKTALLELLDRHADLYTEALTEFFDQQFAWLNAG